MKKEGKKLTYIKNSFSTLEVVVLVLISVIIGLTVGSIVTHNLNKKTSDKNIDKFIENYNYIIDNYYKKVNKKELIENAIKGMLESLGDDYTYLIDDDSKETFDIRLNGEYEGIGVEIVTDDKNNIIVYRVFEESPAFKAELKAGDIILSIDDKEFDKASDISSYVRKSNRKEFKMRIKRDNEEKEITIKRDIVTIKSVESKTFTKDNKKIGYIYLSVFSNSAYKQFKEGLDKLESEGINSLIIDVRDNSGGHLSTAVNILSLFLDSNHIIYQTNTKGKIEKFYSNGKITKKYPIVILQNSNSASASEMLSGALKEEYGALIVGETSFGKGTVQEVLDINTNVEYKITTKEWLTPKGNSINKKGLKPDIEVSLDDNYYENPSDDNDNQLIRAIDEIIKK